MNEVVKPVVKICGLRRREDAELAESLDPGHRYTAACSAALAGPTWHARAVQWLRAELDRRHRVNSDAAAARTLLHWKADTDLSSIRDGDDLPAEFKKLWADVDVLLKEVTK